MIVVTGATGKLGKVIVDALLLKLPPEQVGISVRDPSKAEGVAKRGIRVRQGDFAKADSLALAFEGASQVLIVSSNAKAYGGDALAQHRCAIEAAKTAGVRRIVYTSHMGASASSAFAPMHDHAATEAMLRGAGIAWTALRNGFYSSTVPTMIGDAASTGVLRSPQDGKVSWTTHGDLGAVAAAILLAEGRFEGPTPPLTASEALDLGDVAAILGDLHKTSIKREIISDDEQTASMAKRGVPPAAIELTLGLYRAAVAGEFKHVDPTLAQLLGRRPTTLREVLAKGNDTSVR